MEYTREYWQPRIATNPNRFRKLNDSANYVELINEPEAITQAGTAFTADRLNNMEAGISGAVAGVNEIQGVIDFTKAVDGLVGLGQTTRSWRGMTTLGNDVYACVYNGDIYKQTGGVGDFVPLGQTARDWLGMTTLGNDVYACVYNGDIYKQTNGVGNFIALGQTSRQWRGMTTLGSNVYACEYNGDIYKQTNGIGDFIALGQTARDWYAMTTLGNDVYACVSGVGDIYKQTGGVGDFVPLGQTARDWRGMTTLGSNVYACEYNGDIYKQTNGIGDFIALGQTARGWRGMTTLGNDVYACEFLGDIYTAPVLTGNTFRASASFTLPAMPDGARKRILNTHATNAITVTAYAGTTIEGQATMTLSAGHEVEIELIGTNWKKTGWNEKSLASFIVPVDCTSRVAEYTGDGIPLIPDNVAGTTYRSNFATIDGFASGGATFSVSNNVLQITNTSTSNIIYRLLSSTPNGKMHTIRFRAPAGLLIQLIYYNGSTYTTFAAATSNGSWQQLSGYLPSGNTANYFYMNVAGASTVYYISDVYVGTGSYDTPALDRAGNGNSLTLNAVTPVNGRYGKEMSFNGSTSYAQASSPVIGTTGTVAIRFKRSGGLGALQFLCDNRNSSYTNGIAMFLDFSNNLSFTARDGTTSPAYNIGVISDITTYHNVIITWDGTSIVSYIDNVVSTRAQSVPVSNIITNLSIGKSTQNTAPFNGIISHFRYDSRIWTAEEARAWSLNPISIDSRM